MEEMKELAARAKGGDPEAFGSLYGMVYKDLYRYAYYMLGQKEDAEDAVMETVCEAYTQIRQLREPDAFKGWIFRILTARVKRTRKLYLAKTAELTEAVTETVAAPNSDFANNAAVMASLSTLSEEDRMIILLHIFGGYTSVEIGKMMHMKDATVRSREKRALEKLRNSGM
ncbi:MAG: RNA polymerase sigma factor [Lachnospiraceae bacterium]